MIGCLINSCRTLYKYYVSHHLSPTEYLSMAEDQELPDDQLPSGLTPIWVKPPRQATEVQVLERVENIVEKYQEPGVMLLYDYDIAEATADWCRQRGWRHHNSGNISGCEASCVVLLDCRLSPELITRGINVLIIVNRLIMLIVRLLLKIKTIQHSTKRSNN